MVRIMEGAAVDCAVLARSAVSHCPDDRTGMVQAQHELAGASAGKHLACNTRAAPCIRRLGCDSLSLKTKSELPISSNAALKVPDMRSMLREMVRLPSIWYTAPTTI